MILDANDVKRLTGAKTRRKVIEVLVSNRIRYVMGADGWPRVFERDVSSELEPTNRWEPKLDEID